MITMVIAVARRFRKRITGSRSRKDLLWALDLEFEIAHSSSANFLDKGKLLPNFEEPLVSLVLIGDYDLGNRFSLQKVRDETTDSLVWYKADDDSNWNRQSP